MRLATCREAVVKIPTLNQNLLLKIPAKPVTAEFTEPKPERHHHTSVSPRIALHHHERGHGIPHSVWNEESVRTNVCLSVNSYVINHVDTAVPQILQSEGQV